MPQSFIPPLLFADEPPAAVIETPQGAAPFVLLCDHAGQAIPRRLGDLGLPSGEIDRHIGWDIGALSVSRLLSRHLDATLIHQRYSRLVIDCNRTPGIASSIPHLSELTSIPGNIDIEAEQALAREREIFLPYHRAIDSHLGERQMRARPTAIVAMHSFTPVFKGDARPWPVGLLFNRHPAFAHLLAELLQEEGDLQVGINQPYAMTDATDYTLPVHAERRELPYVGIEIRQDLIADEQGQQAWAKRLARLLPQAWRRWQI
ncbi:N-formylglutamate amidohydrolase [Serratia entomophila]|uniref:N-formylglutamate amidohydrolase n=1 Tax=Serratia entomophila TaxID=42906 RepID=UPI00217B5180|nr:N-formylglutamate amidohydrolase [Serratia entomophila]CAI0896688.1 Predicted N-formylglutamate amidohydrolase [Serratia entomophila]CAI1534115.1 Predicted N-formylglutamate amidohydrolase [Serratia entomophila]CAI1584055.1 Predicted N-formylglutamate amidohydrolase [Serratia entomophila]CAI1590447.1 Predicted N-formylglutamate amidohydrolase [Serratia entomophila]CAI1601122.1 Predicted N-formylglutamate amidohydrolase [Serratia entomophila]